MDYNCSLVLNLYVFLPMFRDEGVSHEAQGLQLEVMDVIALRLVNVGT